MKKALLISFFILNNFHFFFCQDRKQIIDVLSQKEILREASKSLLNWNDFMRNDLDSLKIDAYRILMIGINGKNEFAIHVGKRSLGSYLIRTGKPKEGIQFLMAANRFFEKKSNTIIQTEILNEIGNGYLNSDKPLEAEKFYLKSLKCGKESPDPTSTFLAEANLSQAYIRLGNIDKATAILHHYKNEALKRLKLEAVATAYSLLGTIEQQKENKSLAKEYFRKSADFGFRSKALNQVANAYTNMAIVFFEEDDKIKSLDFFKKALEIRLKTKNSKSISESYFNLGDFNKEIKNYDEALIYFDLCINYSQEKQLFLEQMDALLEIGSIYKLQQKWKEAFRSMEKYADLQKEYYAGLVSTHTNESEMLEIIDKLDEKNRSNTNEEQLLKIISDQSRFKNILYVFFIFATLSFTLILLYKKRS